MHIFLQGLGMVTGDMGGGGLPTMKPMPQVHLHLLSWVLTATLGHSLPAPPPQTYLWVSPLVMGHSDHLGKPLQPFISKKLLFDLGRHTYV